MSLRVLIVDDQALVRAGFRMILEAERDIEVVGEAADGLEAVAQMIAAQSPDVVALQEVDECLARTERIPQTDWLASRLKMYGIFAPATQIDDGWYGIALLSRWQAQKHEHRLLFRPRYADAAQRPRPRRMAT